MRKTNLALLSLVSSLVLLSACQSKTVQPTSSPVAKTSQTKAKPTLKSSESKVNQQTKSSETVTVKNQQSEKTSPAPVLNQQTQTKPRQPVTTPIQTTTEQTQSVPNNINQINSSVEADAPDFVIGIRENQTPTSTADKEIHDEKTFNDYWAPDSPLTKEIVAVPADLIGTWRYDGDFQWSTVTVAPDGLVTTEIHFIDNDDVHYREAGYLTGLIKENEQLYRHIGGEGYPMTPISGLGGWGKAASGIYLLSGTEAYFQIWWIPSYEDLEAYDFSANISYQLPMTKVN